jgi:SAM-dependent methyltransferase
MSVNIKNNLIKKCTCGNSTDFRTYTHNQVPVAECRSCGIVHQYLENFDQHDLFKFYENEYHGAHQAELGRATYQERYDQDCSVAQSRLRKYTPFLSGLTRGLDVGSANNAFVDEARAQGLDCYGVEPSNNLQRPDTTYHSVFEQTAFPPDWADFITLHDVLEHFVDPVETIRHCAHVLKPGGMLIIDFPDFFDPAGQHHWRPVQHLWYMNKGQLTKLVQEHGFFLEATECPIPGKRVYYFRCVKQLPRPTRILMLPGMGDIYWTMIKMQDFFRKECIVNPVIDIWNFDDRPRCQDYIERIPFVRWGQYHNNKDYENDEFRETYHTGPRSVFPGFHDYDYYIGVNGVLVQGRYLDDPSLDIGQYDSNWYYPMFMSVDEEAMGRRFLDEHGPYVMTHFSSTGMFRIWQKHLRPRQAYEILKEIHASGRKIILTGKAWDSEYNEELKKIDTKGILIDMVDKTGLPEFLAMMKYSDGMFGWCGGNTIKSTYFRKPTVMLWSDYFKDPRFFLHSCPPDSLGKWYWPVDISREPAENIWAAVRRAWPAL